MIIKNDYCLGLFLDTRDYVLILCMKRLISTKDKLYSISRKLGIKLMIKIKKTLISECQIYLYVSDLL